MYEKLFPRWFAQPQPAVAPRPDQPPRIPNVFHFCYGLLPQAEFGFLEYLAIKSAMELNRPERVFSTTNMPVRARGGSESRNW